MSNTNEIKLETLIRATNFLNQFTDSLNNLSTAVPGAIKDFNSFSEKIKSNVSDLGSVLNLFNTEVQSLLSLIHSSNKLSFERSTPSAGGESTNAIEKRKPKLDPAVRQAYENMLADLDDVASKKIVDIFLDTGIIVTDIMSQGKTGTVLTAAKDQIKFNLGRKQTFEIPEESVREANYNLSLTDRNKLIKEAVDIYIESELGGDKSALSKIPEYAAGEIISRISASFGALLTIGEDAQQINKIQDLQEKIRVEIRLDDIAKKNKEHVTEQDIEESWKAFNDSMKSYKIIKKFIEENPAWKYQDELKPPKIKIKRNSTNNFINENFNSAGGQQLNYNDETNLNQNLHRSHNFKNNSAGGANRSKGPDPLEVMQGAFGEVQKVGGAMSTLMQTLNIGADTFVGGIINGFNSALSIIQTMITVMQAVNTIKMFLPFATGGSVPGFGDTDSVPAMLTPGEYVVKKSVVNKFGSGFFEWINGGGLTNSLAGHYAGGGMVAAAGRQMVAVSIPDVKLKGSDLYLSWRRQDAVNTRRAG